MQKDVNSKLRVIKLYPDRVRAGQTFEVTMEATMEATPEVTPEVIPLRPSLI
jgi:hypothetical protein